MTTPFDIADNARLVSIAARQVAQLPTPAKDELLLKMADAIEADEKLILAENNKDIEAGRERGLTEAMLDRLLLTSERIKDIANAIRDIIALTDPVGHVADLSLRPNGIQVGKMRIPLGVIAMIYEARPNVTAEAAALCIKSGNAVILRGGSEAIHSNLALARCLHRVLVDCQIDRNIISVIPDTSRAVIEQLLKQRETIDLVIPRGGEGLIRYVTENSQIPVIQHFKGVCHLYIDKFADISKATNILINGKAQKPSACNAFETMLVHKDIADTFLPIAAKALADKKVKVHACKQSKAYFSHATLATDEDYHAEYLAYEIAIKVVSSYDEAIEHINQFTSDHTEVIVSQDVSRCQAFIRQINSSVVMSNASSRFSDGGQLGLGSEIGISTSKLHAYGPMGLNALTTEKYIVIGDGQIRE
ncbi:glutamate-5-semialdehyde dehydrogenase [Thalassotalea sp. 1_MG-2023]|uniref:glutamate-5-semialdehyde dehydrogenase n=1 Tax=Thalassotalea sp. 1_MG-2023 TaxID=3062680 RepID=UPI0026E1DDA9|nr:glutamate-5-semialdehyde dehydrogenase [Thalassotalea sp. 1_MG-2023]MDO6425986.1 glutamate-5-semialdehyde dehydrogenase [Thalassotalea sp. 1_MG-2023]